MKHLLVSAKSSLTVYPLPIEYQKLVDSIVEELENNRKLERHPPIYVMGRKCNPPRHVGFFSDESIGYSYSKQLSKSKPMTENLQKLLDVINLKFKSNFNGILVNKYINGSDSIGKHSDDEKNLTPQGVVSISWGAKRKFRIRHKKTSKKIIDWETNSNEILVMAGNFQEEFTHEIPVQKKITEMRYSFTFRHHTK
jgi:alkylated DNA repair dioxygenase AlkB